MFLKDTVPPMRKNRTLDGSANNNNKNFSVEQLKLATIQRTTDQNTKQQFKLQQGWAGQRGPSTQAILKIIKIKKNKKNIKKISFLSFKYNFSCLLFFLSGSSIANLNSLDLPKNIYMCL